jgi:4a-hydroxytetrahydrobiopterin dehydratase
MPNIKRSKIKLIISKKLFYFLKGKIMLNSKEINQSLLDLDGWTLEGTKIQKTILVQNWKGVMMLANTIGHISEVAWHHPDLLLSYSSLTIYLTSHDVGGVTSRDITLAKKIDDIIKWNPRGEDSPLEGTPDEDQYRYLK